MAFWCWVWFSFFSLSSYATAQDNNGTLSPAFDTNNTEAKASEATPDFQSEDAISLPEVALGNPNAPLKITMYHSLACSHCKDFKENIFPIIKDKFIDKGYVYFILIDFPTDAAALDAAKIAWVSKDSEIYLKISSIIVETEEEWVGKPDWSEQLCNIIEKRNLMTKTQCKNAMSNEAVGNHILKTAFIVQKEYKINYAPAFLLNGKVHDSLTLLSPADIYEELKKLGVEVPK